MLGNPMNSSPFRIKLFTFLAIFGLVNIILVLLYPQFYGREFLEQLIPTAKQAKITKNITFNIKNEDIKASKRLDGVTTKWSLENDVKQIMSNRVSSLPDQYFRIHHPELNLPSDESRLKPTSRSKDVVKSNDTLKLSREGNMIKESSTKSQLVNALNTSAQIFTENMESNLPKTNNSSKDLQQINTPVKIEDDKIVSNLSSLNTTASTMKYSYTSLSSDESTPSTSVDKAKDIGTNSNNETPNRPTQEQLSKTNASKLGHNANSSSDLRKKLQSQQIPSDLIEPLMHGMNSTKQKTATKDPEKPNHTNSNFTTAMKLATSYRNVSFKESTCKLYVLSQKGSEYAANKYKINPDITVCKDQKVPPYQLCKVNETKTNSSFTELKIKCDFSVCDRTKDIFIEVMDVTTGRMKQNKVPKDAQDVEIQKLVNKFAKKTRKKSLPFLFVNCSDSTGNVVAQILTFLPSLPLLKDNTTRNKVNINVFLVDSVSRRHFYRSFPKTIKYLKSINKATNYPAHVFNFELFQAVHGHTNENERAFFNGSLFPLRLGTKTRGRTPINIDRLYGDFKKCGYQTMFLDDLCWRAHWGIMDKYKVGSWNHLQSKLTVSNIDTRGITESACAILHRNKMGTPFFAGKSHQICFNGRHQHEYVLDYLVRYIEAIDKIPQSKPLFAYSSTHVSHDDAGKRVQTLDTHLKDFIEKMSTNVNTLSVIFADHGNTYTSYQSLDDGKREIFHPFMLIIVPKKLGERFGETVLKNLYENQRRLFTLFDLRAGLVELARYNGESALKPSGIFGTIAANRTCDDILITEQSKCICEGYETPVTNTTDQLAFAEFAIGDLNNKIQASLLESRAKGVPYNKSYVVFGTCQRLRIKNIRNVKTRRRKDGLKVTSIDIKVQSSNLVDQEEIISVQVLSKDKATGIHGMSLLSFNRLSTYGRYRTCMDTGAEVKLCICNDPKDPQSPKTIHDVVGKYSEVTRLQRCLYEICRTYNDSNGIPLVKVYEVINVCTDEEFTVTFSSLGEDAIFSTKTPIVVKLPSQTAQFVATSQMTGDTKNAKLQITWGVEKSRKL